MKQNFKSIHNTLSNIIQKYNMDESYADQTIKNEWIKIVNKNIYHIIKPVKIEKQVLYLHVKDEYWKMEFDNVKNQFLDKVNIYLDPYKINKIVFI